MSGPRRILAVIETLGTGGAERALLAQLGELARRGHDCHVAVLWEPVELAPAFAQAGVEVHRLGAGRRVDVPGAARRLAALSRRLAPDVVQSQLYLAGLASALARPLDRVPVRVAVFHNLGYESFPVDSAWRRGRRAAERLAMRRGTDARVAVSGAVARHYAEHLRLPEVTVIPNGIDTTALRAAAAAATAPPREDDLPLVVLPGTFRHEKGHRFLLDAAAGLPVRLAFAGEGPLRGDVERRAEGLPVTFHGLLAHDALLALLADADVVAMPSTHEGLPLSALEAMALGRPVLASAVGGLPELITDGRDGLLVAPGDPAALAAALEALLADPERRARLGRAAGRTIAERYAIGPVADAWERLYDEILDTP